MRQRDLVDGEIWTTLMILCKNNPQLLKYEWAVKLVQLQGGKIDGVGWTALVLLFTEKAEFTDFGSIGFKLLWQKEKSISTDELKVRMRHKP